MPNRSAITETYIRFVVAKRDDDSDQKSGIITALYEMEHAGQLASYEIDWFYTIEGWLNKHLKRPDRFAWSSRPNAPRRAISWLKMSANEHVARMRELAILLKHKDVDVEEIRTNKPGYVVYEDEFQVTAIPFGSETF
jgi:hypothetical protein